MINFIKKKKSEGQTNDKQLDIERIHFNHSRLNQLFNDSNFFIPFTSRSISPTTIVHFLNEIVINDRKCIVEFGSGISTLYIAKLLKNNQLKASFYSIESDLNWLNKIKDDLKVLGLTEYVTFIEAPIEKVLSDLAIDGQQLWYDTKILDQELGDLKDIDLVLVDGPLGSLTPNVRYSAIPYLKPRLASNYSVFLDDTHRGDEMNISKKWQQLLGCRINHIERYTVLYFKKGFISLPFKF